MILILNNNLKNLSSFFVIHPRFVWSADLSNAKYLCVCPLQSLPGFKSHGHKSSSVKSPLSSARSLRSKSAASFNDAASSKSARSSRYGSEDYSPDEASSVVSVASKRAKKTSR